MASLEQKKMLQFLRGRIVESKEAAINGITGLTFPENVNYDGTPIVARYMDGEGDTAVVRSVFGIYHQGVSGQTGVTIFENANEVEAALDEFKSETADALGIENVFSGGTKTPEQAVKEALSGTTYASASTSGETIVEAIEKLDAAIVANEIKSADETVIVTKATTGTDISVNVDGLTIVKATEGDNKGKISTAVKIQYVAAVPASEGKEAVPAHIALMDKADKELSVVQVSDLIGNGVLYHSEYVKETGILHLWFKQADGTLKDEKINLADMLDIDDVVIGDDSKNYLSVTLSAQTTPGSDVDENMTLDVKIVDLSAATETKTGLLDAYDVKKTLDAADDELKALEKAVGGTYTAAEGENPAKFNTNLTGVTYPDPFSAKTGVAAIAATDTLVQAIEKVEGSLKVLVDEVLDNEETAEKAIEALANAAGVLNADDEIIYTANTADTYISGATSLKDADDKLDAAIKSLSANTKTSVIGSSAITASSTTDEEDGTVITVAVDAVLGTDARAKKNVQNVAGLVLDGTGDTSKLDVSFDFGEVEF